MMTSDAHINVSCFIEVSFSPAVWPVYHCPTISQLHCARLMLQYYFFATASQFDTFNHRTSPEAGNSGRTSRTAFPSRASIVSAAR